MWRKIVIILLFMGSLVGNVAAQEKSYSAGRFDVDVVVQEDGSLQVTETVMFDFVGGPFTFVFRDLETDLTDGIIGIQAGMDGRTLPEGNQPGRVEISGNNPIRVEWHLEPTSNSSHTFTLDYQMLGVVSQTAAADLLVFQPLPDEYEYTIDSSTVTFTYPFTAGLSGDVVVTTGNGRVQQNGNQVTVTTQNLSPNETMVVEIPFAPGSLISAPPAWQQQQLDQQAAAPWWIGAGVVILVAGLAVLIFISQRYQIATPVPPRTVYEPPSDLPPGMAGAINASGADPTWSHALATLFDLADRGVLRIEELEEKKWYRSADFVIELVDEPAGLRPHERGLLDTLFGTKDGRTDEVALSDLGRHLSSQRWKNYADPLKAELKTAGFLSPERKAMRKRFTNGGVLLIFLSIGLAVAVALLAGPYALALAGSFFLLGLFTVIMGAALSPLTAEGAAEAVVWQRFADHLKDVAKGKAAVSGPDMFYRFLPYATAYGLLESWAKWFQKKGWTDLPPYFHALSPAVDDGVAAFVVMAAVTSSSGGSAAGAAGAAGAGAAGGGASGAG